MTRREALSRVQPSGLMLRLGLRGRPAAEKNNFPPLRPRKLRAGVAGWLVGTGERSLCSTSHLVLAVRNLRGRRGGKLFFLRPVGSGRPRIPNWAYAAGSHLNPTVTELPSCHRE